MPEPAQVFDSQYQTNIPLIYRGKPFTAKTGLPYFILIIGPSGAGKDAITRRLYHTGRFYRVITATNREPRKGEALSDYVWMRQQNESEPLPEYLRSLVQEYGLFEYNYHYGNMYGTPTVSLEKAIQSGKILLCESENQGALFLEKTLSSLFNVVIIAIIPDNLDDMIERINRGHRDNVEKRIEESMERIRTARDVAHFIVQNPAVQVEPGKSGFESAVTATKRLIEEAVRGRMV